MFQYDVIASALSGKVGFRQNVDPDGLQLTGLTTADHFVNDFHAMLTFENLKSVATDFDAISGVPDKDVAFTNWITERLNGSLKKMVNEWRALKMKGVSARTLIERQRLFRPSIDSGEAFATSDKMVGVEVVSTDSMSIAHIIERIGFQFADNESFTVYVFRDGERAPIYFKEITYTGNGGLRWIKVDWILADGGKYFIGYMQSEITGDYINSVNYDDHMGGSSVWTSGKHFSCSSFETDALAFTGGIGLMDVENTFIIGDSAASGAVWDKSDLSYTTSDNYGVNLEITSNCDYSSLITGQCDAFAYVWALRAAIDLMRELIYNPNSNIDRNQSNAAISKEMLIYEVDGDPSGRAAGLLKDYKDALDGIMFDGADIDKVCLPCKKKGVRFKVHG